MPFMARQCTFPRFLGGLTDAAVADHFRNHLDGNDALKAFFNDNPSQMFKVQAVTEEGVYVVDEPPEVAALISDQAVTAAKQAAIAAAVPVADQAVAAATPVQAAATPAAQQAA